MACSTLKTSQGLKPGIALANWSLFNRNNEKILFKQIRMGDKFMMYQDCSEHREYEHKKNGTLQNF